MAAVPAIPPETIGDRIRRARKAKHLSQVELAEKSGISRQSIGAWETNVADPRVTSVEPLAEALGVPPEWLAWGRTTLSGWKCSPPTSLAAVTIPPGQMALPFSTSDRGTTHLSPVPNR